MSLDLVIRGAGSNRSPGDHLATLAGEYSGAPVILYGEPAATQSSATSNATAADPEALAEAIKACGDARVLVYGDEPLLNLAQALQPGVIWITLGSDANGVREIWRIRQQHAWLSSKMLALLIEQLPDSPQPDLERLLRLSRATRALPVVCASADEPPVTVVAEAAPVAASLIEPQTPAEPQAAAESEPSAVPTPAAEPITETEGAIAAMETTSVKPVVEKTAGNAQEALIQRYALVKERRSTTQLVAKVEETMQNLLKEIFVSRFAAGPEAAAAFEGLTRKLTDASAEFTQLSRTMANLEQQLAKLAWVKEELEI